jgi:hypothetical protein
VVTDIAIYLGCFFTIMLFESGFLIRSWDYNQKITKPKPFFLGGGGGYSKLEQISFIFTCEFSPLNYKSI